MSVLVLHQVGSLQAVPYDTWFADHDGDVLLLASRENLDRVGEQLPWRAPDTRTPRRSTATTRAAVWRNAPWTSPASTASPTSSPRTNGTSNGPPY